MRARGRELPWQSRSRGARRPWLLYLMLAFVVESTTVGSIGGFLAAFYEPPKHRGKPISLVIVSPQDKKEELEEPEEKEPDLTGQIVEIAPPKEQETPDDAEYLAEYEQKVEEETRTDRFMVNPEVLAPQFSKEQSAESEDLMEMNVEKPSTGATVGNDRFDPDRDGTLASLPSPWTMTNKEGPEDPVPSAHLQANMSGAPQNDLLREKRGEQVALNTKEYLYAGYLNRIRRLVNFYWQQNLDNLPMSVRLSKSHYETDVKVVLNSDGALELIEVTKLSGSPELDDCVVRAFRVAGPFPHPPEGLIEKDGRVYLPSMDYTVNLGTARASYQGIDPRAGVQFPGILKSPR